MSEWDSDGLGEAVVLFGFIVGMVVLLILKSMRV